MDGIGRPKYQTNPNHIKLAANPYHIYIYDLCNPQHLWDIHIGMEFPNDLNRICEDEPCHGSMWRENPAGC